MMNNSRAFTRKDLLVFTACLSFLVCLAVCASSGLDDSVKVASCQQNLRTVSRGLVEFVAENRERLPWQVNLAAGNPSGNVWDNLLVLSNYLASPRVFACPSDSRDPALNFSNERGGFGSAEAQNNSVSYFIGTDALPSKGSTLLLGDRNIGGGQPQYCNVISPYNIAYAMDRVYGQARLLYWKPEMHGPEIGLLGTMDGSVQPLTRDGLNRKVIDSEGDANYNNHVLLPY